jgi:siroheme synthase (precorrin-2 oxidase/ferrochelatase)
MISTLEGTISKMTAFNKLTADQLEAFIEKNQKYEKLMPEMLEDARVALLGKRIEETLQYKADVKSGVYKW